MSPATPLTTMPRELRAKARAPRLLAVVLLALQALLWGGGSIIEARAAAESLTRHAHVEDTGTTTCPPIHSHLDCLVCRTLSGGALGGSPPSIRPSRSGIARRPDGIVVAAADCTSCGPLGSRAPPSV
jgi:hypothetical protein